MGKTFLLFTLSLFSSLSFFSPAPVHGDIVVGGNRPVSVHVPPSYVPGVPMPLMFLLHGFTGVAAGVENNWRLLPLADERGFLYAYPQGTRDSQSRTYWNATDACCGGGAAVPADDSGYLRGLIDEISAQLTVDRDRIFFAGHSNGGFMSYRMACDHADVVAAIASLAGATFFDPGHCTPAAPVHVLQIHGTSDNTIGYGGGTAWAPYPGAQASVRQWATYNGCALEVETLEGNLDIDSTIAGPETRRTRYAGGCEPGGSAELWTIPGGSHGPSFVSNGLATNFGVHLMDWLLSHPKRPTPVATFTLTPESGVGPLEIAVDATGSTAPEGTSIASYQWNFGAEQSASGVTASSTLESPGRHTISLVVITDDNRASIRATKPVSIHCPGGDLAPWIASDIAEPNFPSTARLDETDPENTDGDDLLLCSGGRIIGGREDSALFVQQEVSGDFRITARVSDISAQRFAKAGIMFRASLSEDAPFAAMLLETGGSVNFFRFRHRDTPGASARSIRGEEFESVGYVRLERRRNVFSGSSSLDGESWTPPLERVIDGMPETMFVGFTAAASGVGVDILVPVQARIAPLEVTPLERETFFIRGDSNDDELIDISDPSFLLNWLFIGGPAPRCKVAGDPNADGVIDISDATSMLNFLFIGDPGPEEPFPECGPLQGESDELLGCETPPGACQ